MLSVVFGKRGLRLSVMTRLQGLANTEFTTDFSQLTRILSVTLVDSKVYFICSCFGRNV